MRDNVGCCGFGGGVFFIGYVIFVTGGSSQDISAFPALLAALLLQVCDWQAATLLKAGPGK